MQTAKSSKLFQNITVLWYQTQPQNSISSAFSTITLRSKNYFSLKTVTMKLCWSNKFCFSLCTFAKFVEPNCYFFIKTFWRSQCIEPMFISNFEWFLLQLKWRFQTHWSKFISLYLIRSDLKHSRNTRKGQCMPRRKHRHSA